MAGTEVAPRWREKGGDLAEAVGRHCAGDLAGAEACYRRLLAGRLADSAILHGYGRLCQDLGRPAQAEELLRQAIAMAPTAVLYVDLGLALKAAGRLEEAVDAYRRDIELQPDYGIARYNLGNGLLGLGRPQEAAEAFAGAIGVDPRCADFHRGLAEALRRFDRSDEALASAMEAVRLRPDWAEGCNTVGACHYDLRNLDAAIAWYDKARRQNPSDIEVLKNIGAVLYEVGDLDGAVDVLRQAVAQAPDFADGHLHLAFALLRQGNFAEGWAEYEWRRKLPGFPQMGFADREWRGEPVAGKTIMVYGEQGFGDALQFARYGTVLAGLGAQVILACRPPLAQVLRSVPGVAQVVVEGEPMPRFDLLCPMLSVPHLLGTRLEDIPAPIPYLVAEPRAVSRWRERLAAAEGLKVGLVWSGDPRPDILDLCRVDRRRSLPLAGLAPLGGIPGVTLVSLQKGLPARQLTDPPPGLHVIDVMDDVGDFADTAGLVANLDLVISVDTSMVHLVGGMGKPVWILSRFDGCWRWLEDRDDTPWYPSARLYRQTVPGAWDEVVARIAADLRRMSAAAAAMGHFDRGVAREAAGDADGAAAAYQEAIAADPDCAPAYNNLGAVLLRAGLAAEAAGACWRAVDLQPDRATHWFNYALARSAQGQPAEAAAALVRALELAPDYVEAASNLAGMLAELGQYEKAIAACRYALSLRPDHAEAHTNLGVALSALGRADDALAAYRRATELVPDLAQAHANLGNALLQLGRFDEAITSCARAVELDPDTPEAVAALIHLKQHACRWTEDEGDVARLLAADRRFPGRIAPLVLVSLPVSPADQLHCAAGWAARHRVAEDECCLAAEPRADGGRIRLGYLSADLHEHATAHLAAGLFEHHDRGRFEVFAYSTGPDDGSAMRRRLEAAFEHFTDLRDLSDAEAARRIHADRIDVLVDLKGYTQQARTRILAARPAPVQVNYLGFPGTMGAPFIDYILADSFVLPEALEPFFTERVVRLPGTYQCNDDRRPIAEPGPSRAECGLPAEGFVFCCFNNSYKIAPAMFAAWMRLLAAVPGSVLWLLEANPLAAANLCREAAARGVAAERLVFAPRRPLAEHLARYRLADLFLDTLPCCAHTTASDALWAGLPLLTCAGPTFAGRVAGSLLMALGLPELVSASPAEYEARALHLAHRPDELAELRRRLWTARSRSGVFDPARKARDIEAALERLWRNHRAGAGPAGGAGNGRGTAD